MANRAVKILGVVAAVALVGAGGGWYVLSGKTVSNTRALLATLATGKNGGGPGIKITAESIARSPFPTIGVRIVNPKFELTMPTSTIPEGKPQTIASTLQGTTDIITDYLGHQYRIVSHYSGPISMTIGEQSFSASMSPSTVRATLKAKSFSNFMAWDKLSIKDEAATKEAAKNIAEIRLEMTPFTLTDTASNKALMSQEKMELALVNRSSDNTQLDVDMLMDIKGSEITPEYGMLIAKIMVAAGAPPMAISDMPFSYERAGKQDITLDLSVNIPRSIPHAAMQIGRIDVRQFAMKNNYYSLNLPAHFEIKDGAARTATLKLDWSLDATPAGAAEMQRLVAMLSDMAPMMMARASADAETLKALQEKIIAALPTLSTLGPVTLALDIEAQLPPSGASTTPSKVTLKNLAFNHKRWGLEAKGDASGDASASEKIEMNITCRKCDNMTADLFSTALQAQDVANMMPSEHPQLWVNETMMPQVNMLLAEAGKKDPATGDITFAITTPASNDIRINDKPFAEVMMKAMVAFAPAAAQQAPAAGQESTPVVH